MANTGELTDHKAAAFGHAFMRWLVDEDPAEVAHFFPALDVHQIDDVEAAHVGRSVLEHVIAARFMKQGRP